MDICCPYGIWFGFMTEFVVAASASHNTTFSAYIGLERWLESDAEAILISREVWRSDHARSVGNIGS